jgi:hypothetical protein
MGFAVAPDEGTSVEDVLAGADAKMYVDKVGSRTSA